MASYRKIRPPEIKPFVQLFLLATTVAALLTNQLAFASKVIFQKSYTYQASEVDSKVTCRAIALEQVKRRVLEELGTYLESMTEVKNFQLTKDQIITLTAGVVSSEITSENWDGKSYTLQARIVADPDDIAKSINALRKDRERTEELENSRRRASEYTQEIARLKKALTAATHDATKEKEKARDFQAYSETANRLEATHWYDEAVVLQSMGKLTASLTAYTTAIEMDSKFTAAYTNRGIVYAKAGNRKKAIYDFNKAIEMDRDYELAYYNRGFYYDSTGDSQLAITDFSKAISLNPRRGHTYVMRGKAYYALGKREQAARDFSAAINLDSQLSPAYFYRGIVRADNRDYKQAIADYKNAITYSADYNDYADVWVRLGDALMDDKQFGEAIKVYERARTLQPNNVNITVDMATCHRELNNINNAVDLYRQALSANPNFPIVRRNLGLVLFYDLKDEVGGAKELARYLELSPNASDADYIRNLIRDASMRK